MYRVPLLPGHMLYLTWKEIFPFTGDDDKLPSTTEQM